MTERVVDRAEKIIRPIVESLGYVFVDLEYKKEFSGYVLALTIDSPQGITINDCEKVSHALDVPLDENDVTNGASYNFNVSSYGLDRAFKTDYDFNKHIGSKCDIKFYAPFNGNKIITATLLAFDKEKLTVELDQQTIEIERKLISNITAHIEF
ncbi:MAG: ribosome maturation factor RimP [Firmicutes bacterium]|nr:ribosome maturation factor RimP [Bacillota bacterium]